MRYLADQSLLGLTPPKSLTAPTNDFNSVVLTFGITGFTGTGFGSNTSPRIDIGSLPLGSSTPSFSRAASILVGLTGGNPRTSLPANSSPLCVISGVISGATSGFPTCILWNKLLTRLKNGAFSSQ